MWPGWIWSLGLAHGSIQSWVVNWQVLRKCSLSEARGEAFRFVLFVFLNAVASSAEF